jgi:hypothetical protein
MSGLGLDMPDKAFYNSVKNLDMSGFSGTFILRIDSDDYTSPIHPMHPHDSTELLGLK